MSNKIPPIVGNDVISTPNASNPSIEDPKRSISKKQRKTSPSMKKTEETQKGDFEEPPKDYFHVRARRGEATDSHSLAERVRRERISERLKMLQGLVPGCDKPEGTKKPEEGDIVAAEYTGAKYGGVTDCQTPAARDQWTSEVAAGNWALVAGEWDTATARVAAAAITEVAPSAGWD
ncbi:hypothetical protein GIB67_021988 [Kingdonia uniflora]|uniref:BHLH domain-containing protein n=1 Tax=Kingdonia uniflora TaxID=39325 RepID=A0A7J7P8J8_9MAGN|nr:hypothetical protein GIB67_021988 [Kingdonia uniflora]